LPSGNAPLPELKSGAGRRIARNAASIVLGDAAGEIVGGYAIVLAATSLGPAGFGRLSEAQAFMEPFDALAALGLGSVALTMAARRGDCDGALRGTVWGIRSLSTIVAAIIGLSMALATGRGYLMPLLTNGAGAKAARSVRLHRRALRARRLQLRSLLSRHPGLLDTPAGQAVRALLRTLPRRLRALLRVHLSDARHHVSTQGEEERAALSLRAHKVKTGTLAEAKVPVGRGGFCRRASSADLDVFGARTLGALALGERHGLTLLKVFETDTFNCRHVEEQVFPTRGLDETESLISQLLDFAFSHSIHHTTQRLFTETEIVSKWKLRILRNRSKPSAQCEIAGILVRERSFRD
jgi:hypothetical protein